MSVSSWLPFLCMAIGTLVLLRAAIIVTLKGTGRFRADPMVSLVVGFALLFLGQYLQAR